MLNRRTEILNNCRRKSKCALISCDSKDYSRVSSKSLHETLHTKFLFPGIRLASPSRTSPNYWTHWFPVKEFRQNLMWRQIMQKIPWYFKFNVLFIWKKIAAVSVWTFKFQIYVYICIYIYAYIYTYINKTLLFYQREKRSKYGITYLIFKKKKILTPLMRICNRGVWNFSF